MPWDLSKNTMWDLVEEHFDDACFLFAQRLRLNAESDLSLALLASRYEERLLGNVDGLLVAGQEARERLLLPGLESSDVAVVGASALALLEADDEPGSRAVLEALAVAEEERFAALVRALELRLPATARAGLRDHVRSESTVLRVAVMDLLDWHGLEPAPPLDLADAGSSTEVICAVLRRSRRKPSWLSTDFVLASLQHEDPRVQDEALLASMAKRLPTNTEVPCQRLASAGGDPRIPLVYLALQDSDAHRDVLVGALTTAPEAAVWALGYGGRAWMAEALLSRLGDDALAGLAADGFVGITGVPLGEVAASPSVEEGDPLPAREDDVTASELVQASAAPLPEVDPVLARQWWAAHAGAFSDDARYLGGRPRDQAVVCAYLRHGPLRRRHVVALELALCGGDDSWVRTRSFVRSQRAALARLEGREVRTALSP